jgi:hypothetical protein
MRIGGLLTIRGPVYSNQFGAGDYKAQCNGANRSFDERVFLTNLPDDWQSAGYLSGVATALHRMFSKPCRKMLQTFLYDLFRPFLVNKRVSCNLYLNAPNRKVAPFYGAKGAPGASRACTLKTQKLADLLVRVMVRARIDRVGTRNL